MPDLVRCKNMLGPACSVLGTYLEMSQTRLLTAIHLLLSRYRDSSLGSFSSKYSKLPLYVQGVDH